MYFISPDLGDIVHIGRRFYVYITSSKHEGGWENSRKLCKRILESYTNPGRSRAFVKLLGILPTPRVSRLGCINMEKSSLLLLQSISENQFDK